MNTKLLKIDEIAEFIGTPQQGYITIPAGARFLAVDQDGATYTYAEMPHTNEFGEWFHTSWTPVAYLCPREHTRIPDWDKWYWEIPR